MNLNFIRHRRLRLNASIREMVCETRLHPSDFVVPLFYRQNSLHTTNQTSYPPFAQYCKEDLIKEVRRLFARGIRSVLLFEVCDASLKSDLAEHAYNNSNGLCEAITLIKKNIPEMVIMTDVALDAYTTHGHDGLIDQHDCILNDETLLALNKMALSHARAGADFIAPSDMMDGRVCNIRKALDEEGFTQVGIMAYSAKYASCFYSPFRDTLGSGLKKGNKKSYQLDPSLQKEAINEAISDEIEGADMLMVKPAGHYLDIISKLSQKCSKPITAYHVSGEYVTLAKAAEAGLFEFEKALMEVTISIKRAGASLIFTYGADTLIDLIEKNQLD